MSSIERINKLVENGTYDESMTLVFKEKGYVPISTGIGGFKVIYSVGLSERYKHPEILIVGDGHLVTYDIIFNIIKKINNNEPIRAGVIYNNILGNGYKCLFGPAKTKNLDVLNYVYPDSEKEVLLLVWPDVNNKLFTLDEDGDPDFYNYMFKIYKKFAKFKVDSKCFIKKEKGEKINNTTH
jgi:hypothetical protein